jgi:hypothetical protein
MKASHNVLWEVLPALDAILEYFEGLEAEAKTSVFGSHKSIQNSITLAWTKYIDYYKKTEESVAWIASIVLHSC